MLKCIWNRSGQLLVVSGTKYGGECATKRTLLLTCTSLPEMDRLVFRSACVVWPLRDIAVMKTPYVKENRHDFWVHVIWCANKSNVLSIFLDSGDLLYCNFGKVLYSSTIYIHVVGVTNMLHAVNIYTCTCTYPRTILSSSSPSAILYL